MTSTFFWPATVIEVVKEHCGVYGQGVEYAYTMMHGVPAGARRDCRGKARYDRKGR